jgi:DNA mismatch repair protein MutS
MNFTSDKQTLDDLNITGWFKTNSLFRLFDNVVTDGGRRLLDEMFRRPMVDPDAINERCRIFQFFRDKSLAFPVTNEEFVLADNFLSGGSGGQLVRVAIQTSWKRALKNIVQDKEYETLHKELLATIKLLNKLKEFCAALQQGAAHPFSVQLEKVSTIFAGKHLQWLKNEQHTKTISLPKVIRYEYLLRGVLLKQMHALTDIVFSMDVYIAVSSIARDRGFTYPIAHPKESNQLRVAGLYHPSLSKAVSNPVSFEQRNNILFLTGANMAGKSTFMKAFGISVYLAHMGFPVAAQRMDFSVKEGLYSSINVPDNLDKGYSHFYAEVLRVKTVAQEVSAGKDLYVLFDELFKGTNVKDAYDATLSITEAFSQNRNCFFIISTHIIEVGEALRERCDNFQFAYMPTVMEGMVPRYTYSMKEGITTDRQGMIIIENEGILDIIRSGIVNKQVVG